jgi:small subunit ribosomal protein S21
MPIKENIDRALKRYKRKFDKTGTVRQLGTYCVYKPSVKNRSSKAAYISKHENNLEN